MRLGTEDPLQGLQMLSVRDSSPWSPFLKAEEPQWLRRDTVVWTHTVDAECDSAPWPLPLPQGLSGAQGSPGGGQLRLAPCSPVDQAPPPRGEPGAAGQELVQVERGPWPHPELALAGVSHPARWVSRASLFTLVAPTSPSPYFLFLT